MASNLASGIEIAYLERTDFVVFALTGRTGSGCSTAAELLCRPFNDIPISEADFEPPEARKISIIRDFAQVQWQPFKKVSVSSVIFTFLLEEESSELEDILASARVTPERRNDIKQIVESLKDSHALDVQNLISEVPGKGVWNFYVNQVEPSVKKVRSLLESQYSAVFQKLGDNIRLSGFASKKDVRPSNLFRLMRRVRTILYAAREADRESGVRTTRLVIDAVRNPLELVFLRDHFAGLYAVAITVDDEIRRQRLVQNGLKLKEVDALDMKEYGSKGGNKHLKDYESFVSQNLMECMQKADIFVENPGKPEEKETMLRRMSAQLVRYVALCLRPGLVTPTRDERCMQIAFVAKLNSGCISRQVGAAVANDRHSVEAIGWNDVPRGQVPCLLRDADALLRGQDSSDFSDYELNTPEFKTLLTKDFVGRGSLKSESGLRCPFCFKDAYNKLDGQKNQVHTRSLHAEENAFLQVAKRGGAGLSGSFLYTTASPCELCSKKAFQLGVQEIIYVDPYPGISSRHILASGAKELRPRLRLFSGAVGSAYHRLYEAILPIKDEYKGRLGGDLQKMLDLG